MDKISGAVFMAWTAATAISLPAISSAASDDFLVSFWGGDLAPVAGTGWRASLQLDQFTEHDGDTLRFPLGRKTEDCRYYCETIGFNTLQGGWTIPWRKDRRLSVGAFLGWAGDRVTRFLQNEYSHAKNGLAGVPRQGEREGLLFGVSLEVDREIFPQWIFGGMGLLVNNVHHDVFLHSGLKLQRQPLIGARSGIKYMAVMRMDLLRPSQEFLFSGQPYFSDLYPAVGTGQVEAGIYTRLWGIPWEFSWRGGYSTGVFINQDRGRPEGMWLEGLRTDIWKFSFERYNDALNGTDYGPTYGVKFTFSP